MKTGFFVQKHVNDVIKMSNIQAAKEYANSVITEFVKAHTQVKPENVRKAQVMINKAASTVQLAISMQNFVLAHPSEDLKVVK